MTRSWIDDVSRFEQRYVERREYQLIVDGRTVRTEQHALQIHIYSKHEAELLLEAAGFEDVRWFADHGDAAPASDDFQAIICGARKPRC